MLARIYTDSITPRSYCIANPRDDYGIIAFDNIIYKHIIDNYKCNKEPKQGATTYVAITSCALKLTDLSHLSNQFFDTSLIPQRTTC